MKEAIQDGGVFYALDGEETRCIVVYPNKYIADHDMIGAMEAREWFRRDYPEYVLV